MPERNPAAFVGVGSGPIRVLACVSELSKSGLSGGSPEEKAKAMARA